MFLWCIGFPLQEDSEGGSISSPAPRNFPILPDNPTIADACNAILDVVERMPSATPSLMLACQIGCDRVISNKGEGLDRLVAIYELLQPAGAAGDWVVVREVLYSQGWRPYQH